MEPYIKEIIRHVEQLVHCTEVDPYAPFEGHRELNEYKLLEGLKPYIKTEHFKRHNHDAGYIESRIWLPYIRDEMFNKLEATLKSDSKYSAEVIERLKHDLNITNNYNYNMQKRIDNYNKLPWWKELFGDV